MKKQNYSLSQIVIDKLIQIKPDFDFDLDLTHSAMTNCELIIYKQNILTSFASISAVHDDEFEHLEKNLSKSSPKCIINNDTATDISESSNPLHNINFNDIREYIPKHYRLIPKKIIY